MSKSYHRDQKGPVKNKPSRLKFTYDDEIDMPKSHKPRGQLGSRKKGKISIYDDFSSED